MSEETLEDERLKATDEEKEELFAVLESIPEVSYRTDELFKRVSWLDKERMLVLGQMMVKGEINMRCQVDPVPGYVGEVTETSEDTKIEMYWSMGERMPPPPEYPEHDRLKDVVKESQTCGEFLEWLTGDKGFVLAEYPESIHNVLVGANYTTETLLSEFFNIDLKKLEAEKREMLEVQRASDEKNRLTVLVCHRGSKT